jgi:hypothetical protein
VTINRRQNETPGRAGPEVLPPPSAGHYVALGLRFSVTCDDAGLRNAIQAALGPLASSAVTGARDRRFVVTAFGDDRYVIELDNEVLRFGSDRREALEWLLWYVNRLVVGASGEYLLVHAASVEIDGRAVLLPGASGAGKSTISAALVLDGFRYVTDELVALTANGDCVVAFPRSLNLDRGSLLALAAMSFVAPLPESGVLHLSPEALRPGVADRSVPSMVVFPHHRPKGVSSLHVLADEDALFELMTHTVNLDDHGGRGMQVLGHLVERCPCYRLEVVDLVSGCRLVRDALEGGS